MRAMSVVSRARCMLSAPKLLLVRLLTISLDNSHFVNQGQPSPNNYGIDTGMVMWRV